MKELRTRYREIERQREKAKTELKQKKIWENNANVKYFRGFLMQPQVLISVIIYNFEGFLFLHR